MTRQWFQFADPANPAKVFWACPEGVKFDSHGKLVNVRTVYNSVTKSSARRLRKLFRMHGLIDLARTPRR
jgi:hypothetical protein